MDCLKKLSQCMSETQIKRQATQHGCLPSLLDNGYKGSEIVYGEEKKYFVLGRLEQPKQNKNLLYRHDKPNEPLPFVLFESPFTSVSTVSRSHPSLVSLVRRQCVLVSQWMEAADCWYCALYSVTVELVVSVYII